MGQPNYRALIVDDEIMVRDLTARALSFDGFDCNVAADGKEALTLLEKKEYDVLITDLRMPTMHGHALATQVLEQQDHPIVIVVTGVSEPRLAKDLFARGVTDILIKPVDYKFLALKVKNFLADRRVSSQSPPAASQSNDSTSSVDATASESQSDTEKKSGDEGQIPQEEQVLTREHMDQKLQHASEVMPISEAALDVYTMASSNKFDAKAIATAIRQHRQLTQEIILLSNTLFYNPGKERIDSLEQSVVRIGTKRIGQLALAANALAALRSQPQMHFLDVNRLWRHSVASGVAVELLVKQGKHQSIDEGLLLCATMQTLGHIVLARLFPVEYDRMIQRCLGAHSVLMCEERRLLGKTHVEAMMVVLREWGLPTHLYAPLKYTLSNYYEISSLEEPLRTQVELVKLSQLIAHIAVHSWHGWDQLELPSNATLQHLHIDKPGEIIDSVRTNRQGINAFGAPTTKEPKPVPISYYRPDSEAFDFLAEVLESLGIIPIVVDDPASVENLLLVNGIVERLENHSELMRISGTTNAVTIADTSQALAYERYTSPLVLPAAIQTIVDRVRTK